MRRRFEWEGDVACKIEHESDAERTSSIGWWLKFVIGLLSINNS